MEFQLCANQKALVTGSAGGVGCCGQSFVLPSSNFNMVSSTSSDVNLVLGREMKMISVAVSQC